MPQENLTGADLEAGRWNMDEMLMNELVERWAEATKNVEEESLHLPVAVFLGEAVDLASVIQANYLPRDRDGEKMPGLQSVEKTGAVTAKTPEELRELAMAIGAVRARLRKLVEQAGRNTVEEAESVLDELKASLTFVLEDSGTAAEEQLDRLNDDHRAANSHDEMALALQSYAELADEHKEELQKISTFAADLPAQARGSAQALRQRSADKLTGEAATQASSAMRLRNRLVGALSTRMRTARKSIRFVFRDYPEIVRAAASSYSRERQRRYRNQAKSEAPTSGVTGEVPLEVEGDQTLFG